MIGEFQGPYGCFVEDNKVLNVSVIEPQTSGPPARSMSAHTFVLPQLNVATCSILDATHLFVLAHWRFTGHSPVVTLNLPLCVKSVVLLRKSHTTNILFSKRLPVLAYMMAIVTSYLSTRRTKVHRLLRDDDDGGDDDDDDDERRGEVYSSA
jgi:hypothetical protein